jgi:alpha-1,2-mannosyltransferase
MTIVDRPVGKRAPSRRRELSIAAQRSLFLIAPPLVFVLLLRFVLSGPDVAVDFHTAYWTAGSRILHGLSPYSWNQQQISGGAAFVYPALSALFFAPFALIGRGISEILFMSLCIVLVPATLRVLNVRDYRVYGVSLLWLPVFVAWQTSNLTLLLVFGIALIWRYRDQPVAAGALAAVVITLKPFVWPIALWLVLTRRVRATAWTLAIGLALNVASWAVVGFGAIDRYLRLSTRVTSTLWREGYGVPAVMAHLGLPRSVGTAVEVLLAAVLVAGIAWVGLHRSGATATDAPARADRLTLNNAAALADRRALTLAIALMLIASPLVWTHYFALLLVPMAICRPRLTLLWSAPMLMWVCPPRTDVAGWQTAVAWLVAGTCLLSLFRDPA